VEETATIDVIAMNLTVAALEQWLKNVDASRRGEDLGREIGALYREIHSAVDEMASIDDEDEDFDFGDEEDEEDEDGDLDDEDDEEEDEEGD
jgi:hypothetical protein